jgi:hypothetical protein
MTVELEKLAQADLVLEAENQTQIQDQDFFLAKVQEDQDLALQVQIAEIGKAENKFFDYPRKDL